MSEIIADDEKIYKKKKCAHCGKVIYVDPQYIFKRTVNSRMKYFCSNSCMQNYVGHICVKTTSTTGIRDNDIYLIKDYYFERGYSIEEIADKLGYGYKTVEAFCMKCIDDYPGGR